MAVRLVPFLLLLLVGVPAPAAATRLRKRAPPTGPATEAAFVETLDPTSARASLQYITSVPHVAGTEGDLTMAKFVQQQWQSYGIQDAHIEAVPALLSWPLETERPSLALVGTDDGAVRFQASLAEPVLPEDPTSDTWYRNHTYLGYGPSGSVGPAPLVYANFGRPEDFDALAGMGVDVSGKIVLVRYGGCFRGLKVMNAESRGAIGVLIYSDPEQDGFKLGATYPQGPWRPAFGVQRGSVQYLSLCAGDPGRAALAPALTTEDVCGYATEDLKPRIPVLPLSYGDAAPLLESLAASGSPVAPPAFQGGLNFTYYVGPSVDAMVQYTVHNQEFVGDIWNVIGLVKGRHYGTARDRMVVLGNHRDAWVDGAVDPNSGTATQLEVAKGLCALLKTGWKPRRTIVLASWSGEELGLIGSTAWGEANAAELKAKAVSYINVDSAVSGPFFHAAATPSLRSILYALQEEVLHPYSGEPIARNFSTGPIDILGSGSDFTVFVHYLGVSSVDMGSLIDRFRRPYGMYHSVYDSFSWMERFGDPGFKVHVMMAELWGRLALRLADAPVLPLNHTEQGHALDAYVTTLEELLASRDQPPNRLDLAPLKAAVRAYQAAARGVAEELLLLEEEDEVALSTLNDRLAFTERRFCSKAGLPGRKWFRHIGQAPGLYLGYAGESLPGVTQAVNDGETVLAQEQVLVAASRIKAAATYLAGGMEEEEEEAEMRVMDEEEEEEEGVAIE